MDKLEELFRMQEELNDKTFLKNGLVNPATGETLTTGQFRAACNNGELAKNGIVACWLQNYARALSQENAELLDSTPWKWWSRDKKVDITNARIEIVDALHFWLSLALVAGLDAEEVYRLYTLKNRVNHNRQDSNSYFHMNKDESDNETIK